MTSEQLFALLLGPAGLLVASLIVNWVQRRELDRYHADLRSGRLQDTAIADAQWLMRLEEWKARYAEEHAARIASEARLDTILPGIAGITTTIVTIRDELQRAARVASKRGRGPAADE